MAAKNSAGHLGTVALLDSERGPGRDLCEASVVAWLMLLCVGLNKTGSLVCLLSGEQVGCFVGRSCQGCVFCASCLYSSSLMFC